MPLTGELLAVLTADGALVLLSCLGQVVVWASAVFAFIWEDGPLGSPQWSLEALALVSHRTCRPDV